MRRSLGLVLLALLLTGAAYADGRDILVTKESAAFAAGCGPAAIAAAIRAHTDTLADGTRVLQVGAISGDDESAGAYFNLIVGETSLRYGWARVDCATRTVSEWRLHGSDVRLLYCGRDRPDYIVACAIGPNAHWLAPTFHVTKARVALGGMCAPNMVEARVRSALQDFDRGKWSDFARNFARGADFRPLNSRATPGAFARDAYARGDGWSALKLVPGRPDHLLSLRFTRGSERLGDGDVRVRVDCGRGLITSWRGPSLQRARS